MLIECRFCYIVDFLGDVDQPNLFSRQLLQSVADRAGVLPILRLGGDTVDHSVFSETLTETMYNVFEPGNAEAVNTTYGRRLFQALEQNLGPEQTYIFGLNLGSSLFYFLFRYRN